MLGVGVLEDFVLLYWNDNFNFVFFLEWIVDFFRSSWKFLILVILVLYIIRCFGLFCKMNVLRCKRIYGYFIFWR